MGWLLSLLLVPTYLGLGLAVAVAVVGDRLLTLVLPRVASAWLGSKLTIAWSLREGVFEVRHVVAARALLAMLGPLLGLPLAVEKLRLDAFRVEMPLLRRLTGRAPLRSLVQLQGLQLGLSMDDAEQWVWTNEVNADRRAQAINDAAKARLTKVEAWTAQIVQKLKDLARAKEAVMELELEQEPISPMAQGKTKTKAETKTEEQKTKAKTEKQKARAPLWLQWLDEVVDSFAIEVQRVAVTIRDDASATGVGITMEGFEIGRGTDAEQGTKEHRTQRCVRVEDFAVFVNPEAYSKTASYVLCPMSLAIDVKMPRAVQSLVLQQIPERRCVQMEMTFSKDMVMQVRPQQLTKLLGLLRPMTYYADWQQNAMVQDELSCEPLASAAADEYMELYHQQWTLDNETSFPMRLIIGFREKAEIQARKQRLEALEANALASRLMYLRSWALEWKVPSGGTALPLVTKDRLRRRDLATFLARPLDAYQKMPDVPAMVQAIELRLFMKKFELQLLDASQCQMLTFFVSDMSTLVDVAMENVKDNERTMEVELTINRFGILDERNVLTNVYTHILDRNPGASDVLNCHMLQVGSGHRDVKLSMQHFSMLVVFDPLLDVAKAFLPALEEDERTQMRFLAYDGISAPQSLEQKESMIPVYVEDMPQEYNPLLLGGMPLDAEVGMFKCEICLLGDSSSVKSHVLAFTSDTRLKIESTPQHEAIEIELEDVALQPCTVMIVDEGIDLELSGLRTILELEGDGVDLRLAYRLAIGERKQQSRGAQSLDTISEGNRSTADLWALARSAASKKQIVEVEHTQPKRAYSEAPPSSQRTDHTKAGARRRLQITMSDFGVNLSTNDLGVLLSIVSSLNESMKEDEVKIAERQERSARIEMATQKCKETQFMNRLKEEFVRRDTDGGGTLDADEIKGLILAIVNCQNLTKNELDATVRDFIAIVDRDGSGDISLEEFESVLSRQKKVYHRLHRGVVSITGQEYIDPSRGRNRVPYLTGERAASLSNASAMTKFWEVYEVQTGASRTSLKGIPAVIVQKKMVRTFNNYEYAQEAWNRIVNPSLIKSTEQSAWLLSKEMDMGGRSNVIDELLSSFSRSLPPEKPKMPQLHMFVHTIISTRFGGFYIRLIDETLPMGYPSLEISMEELAFYANFAVWEGEMPDPASDMNVRKRATNDYGVAKVSFSVYGKYFNSNARQVEPFLEYYQGTLDIKKEPESHLDILFSSDRYFQLNVTFAFMQTLNENISAFSNAECVSERDRPHITEEDGLFWMLNDTGVNTKYYVVAKKQTKDHLRVETVTECASVPSCEAHACVLLTVDDEMKEYEHQALKEKQLMQAFHEADADGSGELDTLEVREVLRKVYAEEARLHRRSSSGTYHSDSMLSSESELDRMVNDFIALADTDHSGQVSWKEFKIAISKMREVVDRFITLEIEGFEPIQDIPIASYGYTQVYELVPRFEDVDAEQSIECLYQLGVTLLERSDHPSRDELARAYACLRRVYCMSPTYEWIDSYYEQCVRSYMPVLAAVDISVDGQLGLQVKVSGAAYIRNDTMKSTQCLLKDEHGEVARHNPVQPDTEERFFVLPAHGAVSIPLDLVDAGTFAIRQIGETEWSNELALSVHEHRMIKQLTRYEREEVKKVQLDQSRMSISSARTVTDVMGKDAQLPDPEEYVLPNKEIAYPSTLIIDDQPTMVISKASTNNPKLATWSLVIQPQLTIHNMLPCGVEYAIVQVGDVDPDLLDNNGKLKVMNDSSKSKVPRAVKMLTRVDYFDFVNEVNCRRMFVPSGKSAQVFGLKLNDAALMKVRLCSSPTTSNRAWSPPFWVHLDADRDVFASEKFELRFTDGPCVVYEQQWPAKDARSVVLYAPYWIENRSGLDFQFRIPKGSMCSVEQHRQYFEDGQTVPMLANATPAKSLIQIRAFQKTPPQFESDALHSVHSAKYLPPDFSKTDWSDLHDMGSVGTKGEVKCGNAYSCVVAYEVLAAPAQFYRSKIFRISPRFVIVSRVPRPLQVTPIALDKKLNGLRKIESGRMSLNASMNDGDMLVVYHFAGGEKFQPGMRLRDMFRDEALPDVGPWTPNIPIKTDQDINVWTRGELGDGPACNVAVQNVEETMFAIISDISESPRYRIENRSSTRSFRYVQQGVRDAEEVVIRPLESHSFVWINPLAESKRLCVHPFNWKVPTIIDFMRIGPTGNLNGKDLFSEVFIDGSTRVFAVGDTPITSAERQQAALNDWLNNTVIDVALHGFGLTIVDGLPREVMNLTMENIRLESLANSRKVLLTLHHMQIDDMTPSSLYPVVLAPIDSGFNSNKREGWLPSEGERPYFSLAVDTSPQAGIMIVNDFTLTVGATAVKLNLEYALELLNLLLEFVPTSDEDTIAQQGIESKNALLSLDLPVPAPSGGLLMYFKRWSLMPFELQLVFDSVAEDHGEGISAILGSTIGSIVGGIAHVTPEFHFSEILYKNRFFYVWDLTNTVIMDIVYSVLGQWYKIVGSVELLGDPVGLGRDIVDGFALAARQFKRDVQGKSQKKGQSAVIVMQTVVGAPMKSLSKVSNGLGDVVKKATSFQSQEEVDEPRHVPEGLLQSGIVFSKSLAYGVKGLVKEPVRGAQRDGVKGFAKGVGRGAMQLVVSPVVGTLGAVEKFTQSVSNTTHLMDDSALDRTRRPARDLNDGPLKTLDDSNVITELELHVVSVDGLPRDANPQVVVRVYEQAKGQPARELAKHKSTKRRHTSTPRFDQSWLIPITSSDTFIELNVFHKRKPLPKKRLGYLRFHLDDVFQEFDGVPRRILSGVRTKIKLQQQQRSRRYNGSILNEMVLASAEKSPSPSPRLEVRSDAWRRKLSAVTSSGSAFSPEFEGDDGDDMDEFEQDAALLAADRVSTTAEEVFAEKLRTLPLMDCDGNGAMTLSIRYVNDMRR